MTSEPARDAAGHQARAGRTRFYVADMMAGGLWVSTAPPRKVIGFIPTGKGAHGIYFEPRRARLCSSPTGARHGLRARPGHRRGDGHLADPRRRQPRHGRRVGGRHAAVASGRYNGEVYVLSTADGQLLARIPVGDGPHGLCVWPQPGRYSLGHTGVTR